jgi:predicted nucleic acid-binding protein
MIVLDAPVVVELLINGPLAEAIRDELANSNDPLIVPDLLDIEVVSAIRRLAAAQRVDSHRSGQLLADLAALPAERYSHLPLLARIWELRQNFTAYDATYIALAEATRSVLYTSDQNLRKGHHASVVVFTQ